jgi:hypothetical protein
MTTQNLKPLRDDGVLSPMNTKKVRLPGSELVPRPRGEERVMFFDHMTHGLSFPLHPFVRGLLYSNGLQFHDFAPNNIMQITCFVLVCECFLGIHPHWGMWKKCASSRGTAVGASPSGWAESVSRPVEICS